MKQGIIPLALLTGIAPAVLITALVVLGVLVFSAGAVSIIFTSRVAGLFLLITAGILAVKGKNQKTTMYLLIAGATLFFWDSITSLFA